MFAFKFTFIVTILAFLFMTATALPVSLGGVHGSAPGSLLGRTYVQRAAAPAIDTPLGAREDTMLLPAVRRAPAEEAEAFEPMRRSERFQRRASFATRRSAGSDSRH